jgi:hypothetical protein
VGLAASPLETILDFSERPQSLWVGLPSGQIALTWFAL